VSNVQTPTRIVEGRDVNHRTNSLNTAPEVVAREISHNINDECDFDALFDVKHTNRVTYKKKKQNERTRKHKKSKPHKAQFGLETLVKFVDFDDFDVTSLIIDTLAKRCGIHCSDDIIKEAEGLAALYMSIQDAKSMKGVISSLFLYVRSKFDSSVSSVLIKYIRDIIVPTAQAGIEDHDEENGIEPDWLSFLKTTRDNWYSATSSGFFQQFSRVLGLLTIAGVCNVSTLTFSLGNYKILEPDVHYLTKRASDLPTAICDVIIYFAENVYRSWQLGSIRPLFTGSSDSIHMEVVYTQLIQKWNLYKNGNLVKLGEGMTEHELYHSLESLATRFKSKIAVLRGIDKKLLEDKYRELVRIIGEFNLIKVNSGFKRAPFCISYFGDSSVGKSMVSEQVSHYLFSANDLPIEDGRKYTHVSGRKHWDGARSDMLEVKLDDHANTKSEFVENSPCDVIIKVCNNVPFSPPMADLANKGKVWVEPELVSLTTNVENLDAYTYSNNPFSIQRRMHYTIEVRVKKEFQAIDATGRPSGIDTTKVIESHTVDGIYDPPPYHDVWEFDVKKPEKPDKGEHLAKYKIIQWKGKNMQSISMNELMNFLNVQFQLHREQQAQLELGQHAKHEVAKCGVDGCKQIRGYCTTHCEAQFGLDRFIPRLTNPETNELLQQARQFDAYVWWLSYVPDWIFEMSIFRLIYVFLNYGYFKQQFRTMMCTHVSLAFVSVVNALFNDYTHPIVNVIFVCLSWIFASLYILWLPYKIQRDTFDELRQRRVLDAIENEHRRRVMNYACGIAGGVGILYMLARTYKTTYAAQGSLEPKTKAEIDERDGESNVWTQVTQRALPVSDISKTTTANQLHTLVQKNLVYGSIHEEDGNNGAMNALFITSNVILVPRHYFDRFGDVMNCTLRKRYPEKCGGKFTARLTLSACHHIPETDLVLCYIPTGGSFVNLTKHFPLAVMPSHPFRMQWRAKDGEIKDFRGFANSGRARNNVTHNSINITREFEGGVYRNLSENTFAGLCGAVMVSETSGSVISGIHLGGAAGTPVGCYGALTQEQIAFGMKYLRKEEGVIVSGEAGVFRAQVLGVNIMTNEPLHDKSPLNYMPENSQVEYLGSCTGFTASTKSDVQVSVISDHIMEVCNEPNIYCGPKMNPSWYGWQTCLANLSVPATPFEHDLLKIAILDYKAPLIELAKSALWNDTCPLTDHENLNGVPGKKFLDAINLNTSIGYPLSGPKRKFVEELDPTEDKPVNRVLDPLILEEIRYNEECYKRGERAYPIAKACKKDEILTKDKCRIFYGNALSLTYLVRKYYLPILRILQMNPLVSECAVGINSHGPEWQTFHEYVHKFGDERLIGGDYGKYDQKLPSQLIFASLRILIDIARVCNYSDEDLRVMEAMTGDLVFAYINFNGSLIGLTEGTHISGNSLTVIINGICGSLNLRAFFYTQYPVQSFEKRVPFRDAVAIMTYGDDNIGCVRAGFEKFNIKECSLFLAKYGQVYTMPDKESELTEWLPVSEWEFLKRKSVYNPDLGVHLGALIDKSVYKSLHMFMRPKGSPNTPEMACALNVDTALREWFNHGREKYDEMRDKMTRVAKLAGIDHMCAELDVSYDDRIQNWKHKYVGENSALFECAIDPFEEVHGAQSGDESPTEAEMMSTLDLQIDMPLVGLNIPFIRTDFGEIDMLYEKTIDGVSYVLVVELKSNDKRVHRAKGSMQLIKIVRALHSVRPTAHYVGVLVTPERIVQVARTHVDHQDWHQVFNTITEFALGIIQDKPLTYI
jgi:hypothetical protein